MMFSLDLSSSYRVVSHGVFIRLFENVGENLKISNIRFQSLVSCIRTADDVSISCFMSASKRAWVYS